MYISGGLVISGDDSLSLCADGQSCKESQKHMPSLHTTSPEECFHANISSRDYTDCVCAHVYIALLVCVREESQHKSLCKSYN